MCGTCGCGDDTVSIKRPGENTNLNGLHPHDHSHDQMHHDHNHDHDHSHSHDDKHKTEIRLEVDILQKNNLLAMKNRGYFEAKNIFTLNLVSSPGSGKTSLLERTIKEKHDEMPFYVIEGDQQTMNDANRIEAAGAPAIQVNTGNGCHLEADMIHKAVQKLQPKENSILVIENVGNLVCPSMFDLGESKRVVIISVTEGEDKPIKYPNMFHTSDICIINKTDLLPYVDFNVEKAKEYALQVNHHLEFFELSAKTGEGMDAWYDWLKKQLK
ncbi:MAG: hydrogenase accessory protein HypB [Bacteroidetes bacterium HGW-Bacteroidetes-17]|jgi:hydrogenase nickel incorporation protein HypB|nr:MAG: hydrogenase accessory protein HypB [Bacteroidetes bacterium HGW-Bacteroidetes-17]